MHHQMLGPHSYSVWPEENLPAHRPYAHEIEAELQPTQRRSGSGHSDRPLWRSNPAITIMPRSGRRYRSAAWKGTSGCGIEGDMIDPNLAADVNAIARLTGAFKLRSGQVSTEYFDKYRFEADPRLLRRVAVEMQALLPPDIQVLAGLELGGVPLATAMSLASGLPAVFVRKKAKEYGTCQAVEGGDISGRRVVLVEDVITTGGAVGDAARLVREAGGEVIAVVCAIWRGEGSPRIGSAPELPVAAAMTKDDLAGGVPDALNDGGYCGADRSA